VAAPSAMTSAFLYLPDRAAICLVLAVSLLVLSACSPVQPVAPRTTGKMVGEQKRFV
jgi:hypothetical protein